MFELGVFPRENVMRIALIGMYKADDGEQFATAFVNNLKKVNPAETTFVLDASELTATKQDLIPDMTAVFEWYKSTGFKEFITVAPKCELAKSQLYGAAIAAAYPTKWVTEWSPNTSLT